MLKKALVLITITLCLLSVSRIARAGLMLEPGIGYNRGHYQTSKAQGIGLFFRLGWKFSKMFLAADLGQHDLQLGATPTSKFSDTSVSFGGGAGAWRFWYSLMQTATLAITSGATETIYSGTGSGIGMSGKLSGSMNINLFIRFVDFTEDSNGTALTQFMDSGFIYFSWEI